MTKLEVRARIEEIGILPAVRVSSAERARFAVEAVYRAGIPIAEITMTVPKACDVIAQMSKMNPDMVVGAGTVLDTETARRCLDAGAQFLTSPGFVPEVVEFALKERGGLSRRNDSDRSDYRGGRPGRTSSRFFRANRWAASTTSTR